MAFAFTLGLLSVGLWLGALTVMIRSQQRDLELHEARLRHAAKPGEHIGGRQRLRRRTDFRVPVGLPGFLRVSNHARPCRVVDLSRSGAQVMPSGGSFPVGFEGTLTVEFLEFGDVTTKARVVRYVPESKSYGVQFVEPTTSFVHRCADAIEVALHTSIERD
ncbi:MAG: PilZ domain-containing protein [Myxococcota bacterium]